MTYLSALLRAAPSDEEACLDVLWRARHSPDGTHAYCPKCGRETAFKRYEIDPPRRSWTCTVCGHHVYPTAGTIFEKSGLPLADCVGAFALLKCEQNLTARQFALEAGCSYKTALRMLRRAAVELAAEMDAASVESGEASPAEAVAARLESPEAAALIRRLERERTTGNKGFGVRALVGAVIVKAVYGFAAWTDAVRVIERSEALRSLLGCVPSQYACYRFSARLSEAGLSLENAGRTQRREQWRRRIDELTAARRGEALARLAEDGGKHCSRCGEVKPTEDFYPSTSTSVGLSPYCRECSKQSSRDAQAWAREARLASLPQAHGEARAAEAKGTCSGTLQLGIGWEGLVRCSRTGTIEVDGLLYCPAHAPARPEFVLPADVAQPMPLLCLCGCGCEVNPFYAKFEAMDAAGYTHAEIAHAASVTREIVSGLLRKPPRWVRGHSSRGATHEQVNAQWSDIQERERRRHVSKITVARSRLAETPERTGQLAFQVLQIERFYKRGRVPVSDPVRHALADFHGFVSETRRRRALLVRIDAGLRPELRRYREEQDALLRAAAEESEELADLVRQQQQDARWGHSVPVWEKRGIALDKRIEGWEDGALGPELHEFLGGDKLARPPLDDPLAIVLLDEYEERLRAATGGMEIEDVLHLDGLSLARLRDRLIEEGLVSFSVTAAERERLRPPDVHSGGAVQRAPLIPGRKTRRQKMERVAQIHAKGQKKRPRQKPRERWTREKAPDAW